MRLGDARRAVVSRKYQDARVRRDLSPDPGCFDDRWTRDGPFRAVHRRLTGWWVIGLIGEVVVAIVVIYTTPLTVAVIVTNVLTPSVLIVLIAVTQRLTARRPGSILEWRARGGKARPTASRLYRRV